MMKEGGHYIKANKEDTNKMEHGVDCGSDDSADSDALQLFELPKRKLVRPMSSTLRRKVHKNDNTCFLTLKACCRMFAAVTVPLLIAVFVVSTVLCLSFLLIGIAGMKQEIRMLHSRIKNFDAAEKNFLEKKEQLRRQFRDKLNNLMNYQNEIKQMQDSINKIHRQVDQLNSTVLSLKLQPNKERYLQNWGINNRPNTV